MSDQTTERTDLQGSAASQKPEGPGIQVKVGEKFELLAGSSKPLFIAVVEKVGDGFIQIASSKGDELPPVIFNSTVQLRGSLPDEMKQIITGIVTGSSPYFWRLDELTQHVFKDGRSAYRQDISVIAKVVRMKDRVSDAGPCHVVNVSEGGARFSCEAVFQKGEEICLLDFRLTEGGPTFSLLCKILRVEPGNQHKPHTYGCQFMSLKARDQEKLVEEIFVVQNQMLRQRRI